MAITPWSALALIIDPPESWPELAPLDGWPKTQIGWQSVLPSCSEATGLFGVAQCLYSFGPNECFPFTSVASLTTCVLGKLTDAQVVNMNRTGTVADILDAAIDCFDPYYDCFVEYVKTALTELPTCVRASTRQLGLCLVQNAATCSVDCLATVWIAPYANLQTSDATLCSSIQNAIVEPLCDWMQCCPPCLVHVEEATECVANEALDRGGGLIFDTECDFTCTANGDEEGGEGRRMLGQQQEQRQRQEARFLADGDLNQTADEIYLACRALVPGLYGDDLARERLVARSNYFDCLVEQSAKAVEENFATQAPTSWGNKLMATAGGGGGSLWLWMVATAGAFVL